MNEGHSKIRHPLRYSLSALFLALVVLSIVALVLWVPGTWAQRLTAALAVVGIYGLEVGFVARSTAFADIRGDLDKMTSPDILEYLGANLTFLTALLLIHVSIGRGKGKSRPDLPQRYYALEMWLLLPPYLAAGILLVAYSLFHIFVVAMLSYLPSVLASAAVARSTRSRIAIAITEGANQRTLPIARVMDENRLAAKAFLVGVPSALLSILTAIISPFIT